MIYCLKESYALLKGGENVTHLFFDLDGTLLDSLEGIVNAFASVMDHFSLPYTSPNEFRCVVGPPLYSCFPLFGIPKDKSKEALDVFQAYYASRGVYENALYEGAEDALRQLKDAGVHLYIVTGKPQRFAEMILSRLGILSLFEGIVGADMEEKSVEKEALLAKMLSEAHLTPSEEMAMVGDRSYDIIGGKALKIKTVGVLWGIGTEKELRDAGADIVLSEIKELSRLHLL